MSSPLRWVGGKSRLRQQIIERFPEHVCYVEPFVGAGWVLFGKEPSRAEVINDTDGELINFYRVLKHRPAEFAEQFHLELISRQLFNEYRRFEEGKTELERAMRFYYVLKLSFGGRRGGSFGTYTQRGPGPVLSRLYFYAQQFSERLASVVIENLTWQKCLDLYDRPHTLFYCDPPYPATPKGEALAGDYAANMDWAAHEELAARLRAAKGQWLLSYRDHPRIARLYRGRGGRRLTTERLAITYSVGSKVGQGKAAAELLIRNF